MPKKLTENERLMLLNSMSIAAAQYEQDAKNMGAQAGTLEAPLSATYKQMADQFTAQVASTKELIDTILNAGEITLSDTVDPDNL